MPSVRTEIAPMIAEIVAASSTANVYVHVVRAKDRDCVGGNAGARDLR
jgi:hypothetical protein